VSIPAHAGALTQRLQSACDTIEAAYTDQTFADELDVEANVRQREKLCARLESLALSLAVDAAEPSPNDLAERLKLALAARTIGGRATTPREQMRREALDTAERLKQKWQRLGLVIGPRSRALAVRFEKTAARLQPDAQEASAESDRGDRRSD
jgi:hypothetical protein